MIYTKPQMISTVGCIVMG